MGQLWSALIGEQLATCVSNNCGNRPTTPSVMATNHEKAKFQVDLAEWEKCYDVCKSKPQIQKTGLNGRIASPSVMVDRILNPLKEEEIIIQSNEKGDPIFAQGYEDGSKPVDQITGQPKMSTILKIGIGVGALALFFIGYKVFFANKKSA